MIKVDKPRVERQVIVRCNFSRGLKDRVPISPLLQTELPSITCFAG